MKSLKKILSLKVALLLTFILTASFACADQDFIPGDQAEKMNYNKKGHLIPNIEEATFTDPTDIDNPFYPLLVNTLYVYEMEVDGEVEEVIELYRTTETKEVYGIETVVQNDKVTLNGILIEDTDDWLAQDDEGNLWYLGEEAKNYDEETGEYLDNEGSWETGVDDAMAGYWMPAILEPGMKYYQEFLKQEAEDQALVIDTGVTVTIEGTVYTGCLVTKDYTKLEPVEYELKYYAPGVGLIMEEKFEKKELTEVVRLVRMDPIIP